MEHSSPLLTPAEKTFDRIILYLDLDAFFAAIEVRENPELYGKPIIVGGNPTTLHGAVATCSYEARDYGIHAGMPVSKAVKICPQVIFTGHFYKLYSQVSRRIMNILKPYGHLVICGIDEAFLDVSEMVSNYSKALNLAYEIKDDIYANEQLTCSIGIGPNMIISKIASSTNKPNGITIVKPDSITKFLSPLQISKIPGVGKKAESLFNSFDIVTCGDLANLDYRYVFDKWNKYGLKIWKMVNGYNTEETETYFEEYQRKSICEEKTFFEPPSSWIRIWEALSRIIENVVNRLIYEEMQFRTVSIKIRYRNFSTETRSHSLPCYSISNRIINKIVKNLLRKYKRFPAKDIRLVGVKLSNLRKNHPKQTLLSQFSA